MKTKLTIFALMLLVINVGSCTNDDDKQDEKQLATEVGIKEAGTTVNPGDLVHIYGKGFEEGDRVEFDFRWDIASTSFIKEGSLSPVPAEIVSLTPTAITIRMPYRKPHSRVTVFLERLNDRMKLGKLQLFDGQTPRDFRLYGINATEKLAEMIWADPNESIASGSQAWSIAEHPDIYSVVNANLTYGLCGLVKVDGMRQPYFLDLCDGRWKAMNYLKYETVAMVVGGTDIAAIQQVKVGKYRLNSISQDLERSNYATRDYNPSENTGFSLPDGISGDALGDYPGVLTQNNRLVLLTTNVGNGKWALMAYHFETGFYLIQEIEAEAVIPFCFVMPQTKDAISPLEAKKAGCAIVTSAGSSFCLFDEKKLQLAEPFTTLENKAVSITFNPSKAGSFTVLHSASGEAFLSDFNWNAKIWYAYQGITVKSYQSIVWGN